MLISVIVPVYNAEKYLDKCITSLLNQTYKKIEIILVNDGSTDNSLSICNKYKLSDDRITVINKKNGGASSARNAGIKVANGDYIMFADADDYADQSWCNSFAAKQIDYAGYFVLSDISWIDSKGDIYSQHGKINYDEIQLKDYYELVLNKVFNQPYNKIYDKGILYKHNILFDESLEIGEDINFNLDYLQFCKGLFFINECLYNYYEDRENSLCHKYYANLFEINKITYEHNLLLFKMFNVEQKYYDLLINGYFGSHLDCLDREMHNSKTKKEMFFKINHILKSSSFDECLRKCKNCIGKKQYIMLKHKNAKLYYLYYKLSKR